tara:strand:+ start:966 stop:1481 length:516 start_codon:yes stop_codon:yes gene_type:complete
MNYKFIIRVLFCLYFLIGVQSCNENIKKTTISLDKQTASITNTETAELADPVVIKVIDYSLSEWIEFKELNVFVTNITNGKNEVLIDSKETLRDLFSALVVKIPETINSSSIIARIRVLETLAYKLNVEYGNNQNNSIEFELTKKSLEKAYSNLIFQITKTLEKKSQFISK